MSQTSPDTDAIASGSDWRDRRLWGYVQLIRPPNLFTVPGDPLAGMSLAAGGFAGIAGVYPKVGGTVLIALLLYMGGLVLNDWCDRDVDLLERPDRPIPSGLVPPSHALALAIALLLGGVLVAAALSAPMLSAGGLPWPLITAVGVAALVTAYNTFAKRIPWIGIPTMAACRSGSILLGASVIAAPERIEFVFLAAAIMFVYIVLVSIAAYWETERLPPKAALVGLAIFPALLLLSGLQRLSGDGCAYVWVAWVLSALYLIGIVRLMWRNTTLEATPKFIGHLIRNLIFMQAFWIATGGGFCFWLAGVLALWPLSGMVGRWFYSS